MASVIAFDVNETLLDLSALDEPFQELFGRAALRPQWFALMLQLSFLGAQPGIAGPDLAAVIRQIIAAGG